MRHLTSWYVAPWLALLAACGAHECRCGPFPAPPRDKAAINVSADPPEARVTLADAEGTALPPSPDVNGPGNWQFIVESSGSYTLTARLEGYREFREPVTAPSRGEAVRVALLLEPDPDVCCRVYAATCNNYKADLWVDGEYRGETAPRHLFLPPGTHRLDARLEGYLTIPQTRELREGAPDAVVEIPLGVDFSGSWSCCDSILESPGRCTGMSEIRDVSVAARESAIVARGLVEVPLTVCADNLGATFAPGRTIGGGVGPHAQYLQLWYEQNNVPTRSVWCVPE